MEIITFILGTLAGIVATSLLQKPVDDAKNKYARILRGKINRKKKDFVPFNFAFGSLETTGIILDGDAKEIYLKENIHCHYNPEPIVLSAELELLKKDIEFNQQKRKNSGESYMWNGLTYGLTKYTRSRTNLDERLEIHLWFQPSDWYSHCATGLNLDEEIVLDKENKNISLRKKYLKSVDWSNPSLQPTPYFSNTFSIAMCLVTADNNLILLKRSDEVVNPNQLSISVNETMQRPTDRAETNAPDLYQTVKRGCIEEMGFTPKDDEIKFFSLCADSESCCWSMQGMIFSDKTFKEINDLRRNKAKDKHESKQIIVLDFNVDTVVKFVLNNEPWSGGAPACIYYTLTHIFGGDKVDKALKKYG